MGQRSIGLLEKENGNYDAHYTHWLPQDLDSDMFSEDDPLGNVFRDKPVAEGIEPEEVKEFCRRRPEDIAVIIGSDYEIEVLDREDFRR